MTTYFVTATGTGIGKTFTTCALLHAARERTMGARGFKPIISGWNEHDPDSDTRQIAEAHDAGSIDSISPWRLAAPLSPHRAAALEGKEIPYDALVDWSRAQAQQSGLTLIETVGGVMVPLTDQYTTLDWMAATKLPIILVAGSYLGTISHSLTALAALRARKLHVAALVMNESAGSSIALEEAEAGLAPYVMDIPLRITQPIVSSWKEARAIQTLVEKL